MARDAERPVDRERKRERLSLDMHLLLHVARPIYFNIHFPRMTQNSGELSARTSPTNGPRVEAIMHTPLIMWPHW